MFTLNFRTKRDAELVLWAASVTNFLMAGEPGKSLGVEYSPGDRDRRIHPNLDGTIIEVTDSSGGDICFKENTTFFVD